jgi:sugar lactone lactonase YvrE
VDDPTVDPMRPKRPPNVLIRIGRATLWIVASLVTVALILAIVVRVRYGGGEPFPPRTTTPAELDPDMAEIVANLDHPPGNVAVSAEGRVFITFHPDGRGSIKVAELVNGRPRPYPDAAFQTEREGAPWFDTPLSIRIDRQGRLWVLDLANHGLGEPRVLAFDLASGRVVHEHRFAEDIAPLGSHLNDFQVDPAGEHIFIADASIVGKSPALVVYDIATSEARRVLENHESVAPPERAISVEGEPQVIWGLFTINPGVDSIALDRRGEWLYFAAMTADRFSRVSTADLLNESLAPAELGERVESLREKTVSDGITIDDEDNVYVTNPEHSAIVAWRTDELMRTLLIDPRFRWPDGFSFGPDGWLYFTCSALQHVIMQPDEAIAEHAPYQVYRVQLEGVTAPPGH